MIPQAYCHSALGTIILCLLRTYPCRNTGDFYYLNQGKEMKSFCYDTIDKVYLVSLDIKSPREAAIYITIHTPTDTSEDGLVQHVKEYEYKDGDTDTAFSGFISWVYMIEEDCAELLPSNLKVKILTDIAQYLMSIYQQPLTQPISSVTLQ
jgi:hypothetical protein|nr:MAG TPA: hypothetical protein [Caudoviricetes sp.]